jgi:hypothetical protein
MTAPIFRNWSRAPQLQENYPHVYDAQKEAEQNSGLSYSHYYSLLFPLYFIISHLSLCYCFNSLNSVPVIIVLPAIYRLDEPQTWMDSLHKQRKLQNMDTRVITWNIRGQVH